jgi:hypothetical protein
MVTPGGDGLEIAATDVLAAKTSSRLPSFWVGWVEEGGKKTLIMAYGITWPESEEEEETL